MVRCLERETPEGRDGWMARRRGPDSACVPVHAECVDDVVAWAQYKINIATHGLDKGTRLLPSLRARTATLLEILRQRGDACEVIDTIGPIHRLAIKVVDVDPSTPQPDSISSSQTLFPPAMSCIALDMDRHSQCGTVTCLRWRWWPCSR